MCHPRIAQCVVSRGRRALGRGGPVSTLRCRCERLPYVSCLRSRVCRVGEVYTPIGFVIDSDLRDTLRYE
jgi:hypothetical protein